MRTHLFYRSKRAAPLKSGAEFTQRYDALLRHYGIQGRKIQVAKPNQNGDIEQRHHRLKQTVDQALMLRGHRDFDSIASYKSFLGRLVKQLNSSRDVRFQEELKSLDRLPQKRLNTHQIVNVSVRPSSTIRVLRNTYSVHSQLIGEQVEVRIKANQIEVWFRGRFRECLPRLKGRDHFRIDYRHIIAWLLRKPGAFENYLYKEDLFPNSHFRMAYDRLKATSSFRANKEYLKILKLAADEGENKVLEALQHLLNQNILLSASLIQSMMTSNLPSLLKIEIKPVNLNHYDCLLNDWGAVV